MVLCLTDEVYTFAMKKPPQPIGTNKKAKSLLTQHFPLGCLSCCFALLGF